MNIIKIPGANADLAESQPEYQTLPVKVSAVHVTCNDGSVDDVPVILSAWVPTKEELAILLDGGYIELCVLGTTHPPVMLNAAPNILEEPTV